MKRILLGTVAAVGLSMGFVPTAEAQFLGRSADDVVEVSLLEGWRLPNGNHMAALSIRLAPGWKTYWRAPGEGGVPTTLRLSQGSGVTGMAMHWPTPEVFFSNGMRSIGYSDDVLLPIEFAVDSDGEVQVAGEVFMGVCLDVCMPITVDIQAVLPATTQRVAAIGAALSDRPLTAAEAGAGRVTCSVEPIHDGLRVTAQAAMASTGNDETLVIEHQDPMIWVSDSRTYREGGMVFGTVDLVPADHGPFALNRSDLRITVIGSRMTVDLGGCRG